MGATPAPRARPYWHVDAKWVAGLLLVLALGPALLVYCLVEMTTEQPAVEALTTFLATSYSRNGLDDETEFAQVREQFRAAPGLAVQPIPGLRILIREEDFAGLTPRQARLRFFRQWAEPLYREGAEGLAALADDPEMRRSIASGAGPLAVLSLRTHRTLQGLLTTLAIACLVLLVPLVFFSHRFGRLFSPGLVLFTASLPGAAVFGLLSAALQRPAPAQPPTGSAGMEVMAAYVASAVLPPLVEIASRSYLLFLGAGIGLMVLATVARFVWWLAHRLRRAGGSVVGAAGP